MRVQYVKKTDPAWEHSTMSGRAVAVWERPVRWPVEGFPFDVRALRYVLAAAEQLSFSGAAGALGMRMSSVSRRVPKF